MAVTSALESTGLCVQLSHLLASPLNRNPAHSILTCRQQFLTLAVGTARV